MSFIRFLIILPVFIYFSITANAQTADTTEGCVPLKVGFQGPDGLSSYYWDFKDTTTSNLQNPHTVFTKPGIYNVTLQDSPGGTVIGTVQIKVYPVPVPSITAPLSCAPANVTIQSNSTIDPAIQVTKYTWNFLDDGSITSTTTPSVTRAYSSQGQYGIALTLQADLPGCTVTGIINNAVTLVTPPVASFTTTPAITSTCNDSINVSFTNTSSGSRSLNYHWNLGEGKSDTSALGNPPAQTYKNGSYTVSLTVSYNNVVGCSASASQVISAGKPSSLKIKAKQDTICLYALDVIKTVNPPAGSYLWLPGNSANVLNPTTTDSLLILFTTGGLHTVKLIYTTPDGLCSDTASTQVYVDSVAVNISTSDTFTCQTPTTINYKAITTSQPNLTYAWQITRSTGTYTSSKLSGNYLVPFKTIDSVKNVKTFNYTYYSESDTVYYGTNKEEDFVANITVVNPKTGCKASASSTVQMWIPNAQLGLSVNQPSDISNASRGCAPLTIDFKNFSVIDSFPWKNKIISSKWIFGDGQTQTISDTAHVTHTYTAPGIYYPKLVITTSEGCTDTSYSIPIQVGEQISTVDFTSSKTSVCVGESLQLSVVNPSPLVSAYKFITDNNNVAQCGSDQNVTYTYKDTTGPQTVTLMMDYNGCLSTVTKPNYITVNGSVAKIDYYALCSSPMTYTFTSKSSNATTLNWDFGDGQTSTSTTQAHTYTNTGDYTVTLTTTGGGCPNNSISKTIHPRKVQAKITQSDSLYCINQPYSFDASQSVDVQADCPYGYTWQFPDMDMRPYTSSLSSASFSFDSSGKHVARLIVRDINGCTDTATKAFKVFKITTPAPYVSKSSICVPNIDSLQSLSVGDTTLVKWQWSFGDGKDTTFYDLQGSKKIAHSYTVPPLGGGGSYIILLSITDTLGCSATTEGVINYYKPVSTISGLPRANMCEKDSITLTATDFTSQGSSLAFAWDLGNGQTSTKDTVGPIVYPVGNSIVKLTYTEKATGCKDTTSMPISVQSYPHTKIVTDPPSDTICAISDILFYDSTTSVFPTTNSWDFGNGHTGSGTGLAWAYDRGVYNVVLTDQTSNGCADTAKTTLHLFRPLGTFNIDKSPTICRYDSITFRLNPDTSGVTKFIWSFGDGTTVTNQSPVTHQYNFHPPNGFTIAKIILYDGICPNNPVYDTTITIQQVIADFTRLNGTDTAVCLLPQVAYSFTNTSQNANSYTWFFGDGSTSTAFSPSHLYTNTGTYEVTLAVTSNTYGCTDTLTQAAVVNPNPNLVATGDTVCLGQTPNLIVANPDPASHYLWSPSTGLSDPTSPTPTVNLQQSVVYTLLQTNQYGCTDTAQVPATIIQKPPFSNWDTTIVIGDSIPLPIYGRPVYSFKWAPADSLNTLSCLNCNYPIANPLQTITYVVTVTDARQCFIESYDFVVNVKPETFIKMPSAFTPNGDGKNDILYVKGWGIKELKQFEIFNRWGQRIYISSDINQGWDGRFEGKIQNEDVYVYKVIGTDWHDKDVSAEGYVNLLH